jgi:hypothetical protein
MFRTTLASLFCLAAAASAHAQEGLYGGAFVSRITYAEDGLDDANPTAVGVKLGASINKNFAVEARLGVGLSDDSINVLGVPVSIKVNNFIGVYGKGILPLSNQASLYGLLGYTQGKLKAEFPGGSTSESDSDVSYGVGGDFAITPTTSLNVEWARLFKGDGYKVDGLTFGVSFKF